MDISYKLGILIQNIHNTGPASDLLDSWQYIFYFCPKIAYKMLYAMHSAFGKRLVKNIIIFYNLDTCIDWV